MEGRIRCDDPKTYKDWSTKKIKQLSKLQKYLLRSAVSATKVGGTIVYSTCTLTPEENEEVIEWVINKTPNALVVEKIEIPALHLENGFTFWKNRKLKHTANSARILIPPPASNARSRLRNEFLLKINAMNARSTRCGWWLRKRLLLPSPPNLWTPVRLSKTYLRNN